MRLWRCERVRIIGEHELELPEGLLVRLRRRFRDWGGGERERDDEEPRRRLRDLDREWDLPAEVELDDGADGFTTPRSVSLDDGVDGFTTPRSVSLLFSLSFFLEINCFFIALMAKAFLIFLNCRHGRPVQLA